ncbi:trypsin-like peptidase domain-containing protein [Candidatus Bathyarchaeota archaeon]|nr:trypsin-like peptidase domain-containing protein [Candidatus Bathyarchaeota archaeon]
MTIAATDQKLEPRRFSITLIVVIIVVSLIAGGILGYSINTFTLSGRISDLQNQVSALQEQVSNFQSTSNATNQNSTYIMGENASLAPLYAEVKDAIVVIRGLTLQYDVFRRPYYSQVQGSGFVYDYEGQMVVITNNHVVEETINITVTFINGNGHEAAVLGSDPYADLAVLSTNAPQSEYEPLEIASSSTLNVGDSVIAVGGPYGLAGSMTTGIVSALGRTITAEMSGSSYPIANVIQMSAPINPGNSGGPLLNYQGQVVGITTAIVSDSQGVGFAIPSSTVLREIESLITEGSFNQHPWLGASGIDMTYEIAETIGVDVTYGWLIVQVTSGGPADAAGLQGGTQQVTVAGESVIIGGDIIIALSGTRIKGIDDLSTFLEENALPDQSIDVTIIRNGETVMLPLTLGTRP